MAERNPGQIPERFIPLVEGRTAHDAVRAAVSLIESTPAKSQRKLLADALFRKIVYEILDGLDECRIEHTTEIIGAFNKKAQPEAFRVFSDHSN